MSIFFTYEGSKRDVTGKVSFLFSFLDHVEDSLLTFLHACKLIIHTVKYSLGHQSNKITYIVIGPWTTHFH